MRSRVGITLIGAIIPILNNMSAALVYLFFLRLSTNAHSAEIIRQIKTTTVVKKTLFNKARPILPFS